NNKQSIVLILHRFNALQLLSSMLKDPSGIFAVLLHRASHWFVPFPCGVVFYDSGCPKQYFLEATPTGPTVSFQSYVECKYDGSYGSCVAAFMLREVAYYSKLTESVSS
ncbi:hypothetical protein STEG23_035826, partial [Scotinomys teguina]